MVNKIWKIIYQYRFIFLLLLFAVISHWQWFSFGNILNSGDWSYRFDESVKELYYSFSPWRSFLDFGFVNVQIYSNLFFAPWSLLANIGLSYDAAVKITFLIPIAIMGFLSPYFFIRKLIKDNFIGFVSALFYGAGIYFLTKQMAHLPIAFVYAIAPLIFYLFVLALEKNKLRNWLIFILLSFVGICYEPRIMYIVCFMLILYFFFFYFKSIKKYFKAGLLSIIVIIFLNLFWLLPTLLGGFNSDIQQVADRGLFGSFLFSLPHAFNIYNSSWTGGEIIPFIKQPITIYFWLVPLMALSVFLFKNLKYKKEVIFFGTVSLIGIFLTKQTVEPLADAYIWLYNNFPGFNLFREASKFYLVTTIGYMGLLAYLLLLLKENKNKILNKYLFIVFSGIILLISIFNTKPLITGEIRTMFVSKHIPDDYLVLKDFVLRQPDYFRTFWTPTTSRWGIYVNNHPKISNVSVVGSNWENFIDYNQNGNKLLIQDRIVSVFKQPFSNALFDLSSIKYIVVPLQDVANDDDFFISYGGKNNPDIRQYYIDQLDKVYFLKKIDIGTNDLVVYENEKSNPPIFSFNKVFNIDSLLNLDRKYDFITNGLKKDFYFTFNNGAILDGMAIVTSAIGASNDYYVVSDSNKELINPKSVNFELISPTKKLVHINGVATPFYLAMNEGYHSQWQLQFNNNKINGALNSWWPFVNPDRVLDKNHIKLNDFLNAWYVNPLELCENNNKACQQNPDGSYNLEMVIEFWPQRWFYLGLIISGVTLFSCLGYLCYDCKRRKRIGALAPKSDETKI